MDEQLGLKAIEAANDRFLAAGDSIYLSYVARGPVIFIEAVLTDVETFARASACIGWADDFGMISKPWRIRQPLDGCMGALE